MSNSNPPHAGTERSVRASARFLILAQVEAMRRQADVLELAANAGTFDDDTDETEPDGPAPLLDRQGLAKYLGKGVASIDRMVRDGMPYVRAGDVKRFARADVDAWMKERAR